MEGRDNDELIRFQHIDFIIHTELTGAVDVQIKLIEVVAMESVVLTIKRNTVETFIITASMTHGAVTKVGYLLGITHISSGRIFNVSIIILPESHKLKPVLHGKNNFRSL